MGIPLENITALIVATPGIRLVELADQLEEDAKSVERALAPALEDGSVQAVNVPIFGGRMIASYSMTGRTPAPSPVVPPVSAPSPAAPAADVPSVVEPKQERRGRKAKKYAEDGDSASAETLAERVLTFIRAQPDRRATNEAIRQELKLPQGKYASNYFRRLIEDGTLVRVRDGWAATPLTVGGRVQQGVSEQARAAALNWESRKPAAPAADSAPIDDKAEEVQEASVSASAVPEAMQDLRIAVWSDGVLELRRGDAPLAVLTALEHQALERFLSRRSA